MNTFTMKMSNIIPEWLLKLLEKKEKLNQKKLNLRSLRQYTS